METFGKIIIRTFAILMIIMVIGIPLVLQYLAHNGPKWIMMNANDGPTLGAGVIICSIGLMIGLLVSSSYLFTITEK